MIADNLESYSSYKIPVIPACNHAVHTYAGAKGRPIAGKKITALDFQGLYCGGDSWTRTNDPIDVNDVLYRLSHATVYINYDGYAIYSMTFKPKAKVGLMTAEKVFCQRSRGYAKIGIGSQYGLAKISFEIVD